MPWHPSPKKRLRRDSKKSALNKSRMSHLRTLVKKARSDTKDINHLRCAQSALAVAASKGLLHRNTAARKIKRLMVATAKAIKETN